MKRVFDFCFALSVIIIFIPIGILIASLLRITAENEVFFYQRRVGVNGKMFNLIKFATMLKNSPNLGAKDVTITDDPRVLPFGVILRKTKLNEFPQFMNVLLGDMSLVGPRPLVLNQFKMFTPDYQKLIKDIRPGITGIGSIVFRDEEKLLIKTNEKSIKIHEQDIIPFKEQLETWYVQNKSLVTDMLIIFYTVFILFAPNSALHNYIFKNLPRHETFNP